MSDFISPYYIPMDRAYHTSLDPIQPGANVEEPIIPLREIGQTVPEIDQATGRNMLQSVQAAIRRGAGTLQIVFITPPEAAIGGRAKAYGKEIREAIREVSKANELIISGVELPTSINNMSGLDMGRGVVDEVARERNLREVFDAIKFTAEAAEGGHVDVVSLEYPRPLFRQSWNPVTKVVEKDEKQPDGTFKKLKDEQHLFQVPEEKPREEIRFVDARTGGIIAIPVREGIFVGRRPGEKPEDVEQQILSGQRKVELNKWDFDTFKEDAKLRGLNPFDVLKEEFLKSQIDIAKEEAGRRKEILDQDKRQLDHDKSVIPILEGMPQRGPQEERELELARERVKTLPNRIVELQRYILAQERTIAENETRIKSWEPFEDHVRKKAVNSYADAGLIAMNETHKNPFAKRPIVVGPENGWPEFYGSHPDEYIEFIREARKRMAEKLVQQGYASSDAKEQAQTHIKGLLDTQHLSMFLQHFKPELPWDKRIDEFKGWYLEQMKKLAEVNAREKIIGSVQAVDSASSAHGHLPPGQGILGDTLFEAIKILKGKGKFDGYIQSEGHEEERFGDGRILLKTWEAFKAPIGGYFEPTPMRWPDVRLGYFGRTYSPTFIFGAYSPSNEFKLWSEIPLE